MKFVVLGGGISGLSTAYFLARGLKESGRKGKVVLVTGPVIGGWIQSRRRLKGVFELGPRSLRPFGMSGMATLELVHDLGLEDEIVAVGPDDLAAKNRYIYYKGDLQCLPNNPLKLLYSKNPLVKGILLDLAREPFKLSSDKDDESIYSFMQRRFGTFIASNLVTAIIHGIYAGDSQKLSVRSTMPTIWDWEKNYGSIFKGMIMSSLKSPAKYNPRSNAGKEFINSMARMKLYSFKNGMQTLTDSLLKACEMLGVEVVKETSLQLTFNENLVTVKTNQTTLTADIVICATPASELSQILPKDENFTALRNKLNRISCVTVAVVNLLYDGDLLKDKGFGFLVPATETQNCYIIGTVFDSCSFPPQGSDCVTNLTVMMGGHLFEEKFGKAENADPASFLQIAVSSVERILKIDSGKLIDSQVSISRDCIPQYHVGHSEVISEISSDSEILTKRKLFMTGASYQGVSVNDCVYNAHKVSEKILNL
jgi:oxygen-dependent protoporphyrinogen oxidase